MVPLALKTSVATTQHRCRPHLALQLRNAHYRNLGCQQPPLECSPPDMAGVTHTERVGRHRMGMVIFSSTCIVRVRCRTRVRHAVCHPASRNLVSRGSRARLCVRAISTLVGFSHVSRFWLLGATTRTPQATPADLGAYPTVGPFSWIGNKDPSSVNSGGCNGPNRFVIHSVNTK